MTYLDVAFVRRHAHRDEVLVDTCAKLRVALQHEICMPEVERAHVADGHQRVAARRVASINRNVGQTGRPRRIVEIDDVVARTGKRAIPQFVIDGEWVQPYLPGKGFLYDEMAKRLGVGKS